MMRKWYNRMKINLSMCKFKSQKTLTLILGLLLQRLQAIGKQPSSLL